MGSHNIKRKMFDFEERVLFGWLSNTVREPATQDAYFKVQHFCFYLMVVYPFRPILVVIVEETLKRWNNNFIGSKARDMFFRKLCHLCHLHLYLIIIIVAFLQTIVLLFCAMYFTVNYHIPRDQENRQIIS